MAVGLARFDREKALEAWRQGDVAAAYDEHRARLEAATQREREVAARGARREAAGPRPPHDRMTATLRFYSYV